MKTLLLIILVFFAFNSQAIDLQSLLKKAREANSGDISYSTVYKLYRGHKTNSVHETYSGNLVRSKSNVYQKINNTELVFTEEFSLTLSHDEKIMQLGNGSIYSPDLDIDNALNECSKTEIEELSNFYRVTFIIKSTSSNPCSVIKFRIDKSTFRMTQLDLYYSGFEDFSDDYTKTDLQQPHLRIEYTNFNPNPDFDNGKFTIKSYLDLKKNIYSPTKEYSEYELIDNRI